MDYYTILGVNKNSSQEEIKKAYRKLAHQFHPDKGGDEKKFKEINEAYQILGNKEKREQYDKFGRGFDGGVGGQGFGEQGGFDFGRGFDFGGFDLGDIFEDFFGAGRRQRRKEINRGEDIEIELKISLEEVLSGVKKNISLEKMIACQRCNGSGGEPGSKVKECFSCRGTGEVQQIKRTILGTITHSIICPECRGEGKIPEKPCNVCHGEGRLKGEENITVFIPAGVDTGQTMKIDLKGDAGRRGGGLGDLYAKFFVKPHALFQRKGDDLVLSLPISFSQATLGDAIEVKTLDGKIISLKVPEGTESGKVIRISGKGIPHFSGWGTGNLYVQFIVKTPKKVNKKQKDLLEQLRKEGL